MSGESLNSKTRRVTLHISVERNVISIIIMIIMIIMIKKKSEQKLRSQDAQIDTARK